MLIFFFLKLGENTVEVVKTVKIHKAPITASAMSSEGLYLGVGACDGSCKIINLRYLDVEANDQNHDFVVKGISFTTDSRYLLSGTPEMDVNILQNLRPSGRILFVYNY